MTSTGTPAAACKCYLMEFLRTENMFSMGLGKGQISDLDIGVCLGHVIINLGIVHDQQSGEIMNNRRQ